MPPLSLVGQYPYRLSLVNFPDVSHWSVPLLPLFGQYPRCLSLVSSSAVSVIDQFVVLLSVNVTSVSRRFLYQILR